MTTLERTYHRVSERHILTGHIDILDRARNLIVGRLVNISEEGLMIMGPGLVLFDHLYQFELQLPYQVNGRNVIPCGVDCLWTRASENGEQHWAGFQIIALSDEARADILTLIASQD